MKLSAVPIPTYPDIFLNPQHFLPRFKKFPSTRSVLKPNSTIHTHPTVSVPQYWFIARRDWTRFFLSLVLKVSGFTDHTLSDSLRMFVF